MDNMDLIILMIIGCLVFMGFIMFSKQIKVVVRVLLQGGIGIAAVYILNFLLSPFSLAVGVNIINGIFMGVLGIPALVSLYILQVML